MSARVSRAWANKAGIRSGAKYGNRKVTLDGIEFDSQREADKYADLILQQRARMISDLQLQVRFDLIGANGEPLRGENNHILYYLADFTYRDAAGTLVVADSKGMATPVYRLKKAILRAQGVEVIEV
jgi:hypothetical protein